LVLGALLFAALGLLGRATIIDDHPVSLVWPAAGISMLLFGLTTDRWWVAVAALVAVSTVAVTLATGATRGEAAVFVGTNLVQAIGGVLVLRFLAPNLLGVGGTAPLQLLRQFWAVLTGCLVGAGLAAALGTLARHTVLDQSVYGFGEALVWWGRNAVGSVVVLSTAMLALASWQATRTASPAVQAPPRVLTERSDQALQRTLDRAEGGSPSARGVEIAMLTLFTVAVYYVVFVKFPSLPVAFPLLLPTVWAGMRFNPLPVAVHSLLVGAGVVSFTVLERGPFTNPTSWQQEVLISQLFIGLTFCLGMLLSLGRTERLALTRTLLEARAGSERQAQLMSTVIDTMRDGVTLLDESGRVLKRNPSGAEMMRTTPDNLQKLDDSSFRLLGVDGHPLTLNELPWVEAFADEHVLVRDILVDFDDGSPRRTLAVTARRLPTTSPDGLRQAVVVYHDVTEERAQRSELESFAGVVAHDLLGPLAVIDGWSEVLAAEVAGRGTLSEEEAAPKLERVRAAAVVMRQLIDDLLESSTSTDSARRHSRVDLESLVGAVAEQHREVSTGVSPTIEVGPLPPVHADRPMIRQVLDNLIGNAVKYVRPGEVPLVRISARQVGELVEVTVDDDGVGIPPTQRDRVFEAFQRGDAVEGYAGHGIGLAVCKRIVERHGGRIQAHAPDGNRGARIVFTLPAANGRPPRRDGNGRQS
jgi:signal transduction histidine kinase